MTGGELILTTYSISIRGGSHDRTGLPCQDSSGDFSDDGYSLVIVSDGHGSARHFRSNEGSRIAVEVTKDVIRACMGNGDFIPAMKDDPESTMHHLCNAVIAGWMAEVNRHIDENPRTVSESEHIEANNLGDVDPIKWYGATLIAGVMSDDIVFGFQIGDGDLVLIHDSDGPFKPIPEDDSCFLNRTTSICGSDASLRFRSFATLVSGDHSSDTCVPDSEDPFTFRMIPISPEYIRGILVCTDGLTTSFNSEESFLRYCEPACDAILTTEGRERLESNLRLRSRSNVEDDVSVSIAIRPVVDRLPEVFNSGSCKGSKSNVGRNPSNKNKRKVRKLSKNKNERRRRRH